MSKFFDKSAEMHGLAKCNSVYPAAAPETERKRAGNRRNSEARLGFRVSRESGGFESSFQYPSAHLDLIARDECGDVWKGEVDVFENRLCDRLIRNLFWENGNELCLKDLRLYRTALPKSPIILHSEE